MLTSTNLQKLRVNFELIRTISSLQISNEIVPSVFINRNPRSLEKIRIGYKPDGYHIDKPGKCCWHKYHLFL